ncbi:hypothetical protein ABZX75_03655 [Streptomyces sp. NPDC003038]
MQDHGDPDVLPGESGLSTEDLAQPETADTTEQSAVFPGEATTDRDAEQAAGDEEPAGEEERSVSESDAQDKPLLDSKDAEEYRRAWSDIQGRFVDDPQDAVRSADTLVAEVMQTLAKTFSDHKKELQGPWDRGEEVATEDLRLALQHYRSFFDRLLKT